MKMRSSDRRRLKPLLEELLSGINEHIAAGGPIPGTLSKMKRAGFAVELITGFQINIGIVHPDKRRALAKPEVSPNFTTEDMKLLSVLKISLE